MQDALTAHPAVEEEALDRFLDEPDETRRAVGPQSAKALRQHSEEPLGEAPCLDQGARMILEKGAHGHGLA
jgi:hypothetical protein